MPKQVIPSRRALFAGFFKVGLQGFGGVLPWARRMLVDERGWLSNAEFTEVLSLGQILPGPNIVNVAIVVGSRFQGVAGALITVFALMAAPMVIVLCLAHAYDQYAQLALLHRIFSGVTAAAAGLVLGMGLKLAQQGERAVWVVLLGSGALIAVGLLKLPLIGILLVLGPLGIALGKLTRARADQAEPDQTEHHPTRLVRIRRDQP